MSKSLMRGLVLAGLMTVVRLVQGTLINLHQTQAVLISSVSVAVIAVVALVWGWRDGQADARANPDPDHRDDLAMTWLVAGLIAGGLSGVITWIISLFYPALYSPGIAQELTTFAAFTALLVFLPATLAVALGRVAVDRKGPEAPHHGGIHDDRADTDVFEAITADTVEVDTVETDVAAAGAALGSGAAEEPRAES
ncbi:MAG: B-4DMT family transporter [Mycolicibacterium insubricum]|nr:B-4DMT family transporter [Mycobacterium sp.]